MFRGSLFVALIGCGIAQNGTEPIRPVCDPACTIDLTALEEFTSDYKLTIGAISGAPGEGLWRQSGFAITTSPFPPSMPTDHGTVAVHARNLQLKLDNHLVFPEGWQYRPGPMHDQGPPPRVMVNHIMDQLAGSEIHEELHINGVAGQASFHVASPIVNMCILVDVPAVPIPQDQMEMSLEQAQSVASREFSNNGIRLAIDGEPSEGIGEGAHGFFVTESSHPEYVLLTADGPHTLVGLKFDNYSPTVGDAFAVRACEIEHQSATQTTLAGNAELRDFMAGRIATHQRRLQALLEPMALNTRFNFIPLQALDSLMPPASKHCTNEVLAQTAPMAVSALQTVLMGVCSCAMGVAVTFGALRKKSVPSADVYFSA